MKTGTDRLRVLLVAEACNPAWTSVPLVGYNFAHALAARPDLDVTVATHVRNRPFLQGNSLPTRAKMVYVDNEWLARPLWRLSRLLRGGDTLSWTTDTALSWFGYIVFERTLLRVLRESFRRGDFDLVHRVTPLSPTVGSPLAGAVGVPMVLGPLNGGLPWPAEYPELRRQEREWLSPLRPLYRVLPYFKSTYRRLAGVIAGSAYTAQEIPAVFAGRRFYLPENGVDPDRFPLARSWCEPKGRFRFVTAGRLVPYKGLDLTLEAMAGSPLLRECDLVVVGDGPERPRLQALADTLGLGERVRFVGFLPQCELAQHFSRCQAFVFPSLREFGGGVVLEALASGLPTVVVAYGGPGELASPECGVLLPMSPREKLVPALRRAMEELAGDPHRCAALSAGARSRVREHFTWAAKASRLVHAYHQVLAR